MFGGKPPSDNIYIADLPEDVTDDLIHTVFGAYGTILTCRTMQAKFQGQKGAALVRFASVAEAEAVVGATRDQIPQGLAEPVTARFADGNCRPQSAMQEPQYASYGSPAGGGMRPAFAEALGMGGQNEGANDNIYVADLPGDVTDTLVQQVFGSFGTIVGIRTMQAKYDGQKGAALIRFASAEEAALVVESCRMTTPAGLAEPVTARFADQKGSGKGGGKGGGFAGGGYGQEMFGGKGGAASGPYGSAGGDFGQQFGGGGNRTKSMSDITAVIKELTRSKTLPVDTDQPTEHSLYVMGLPVNTTDADLYRLFSPFGAIPLGGIHARQEQGKGCCSGVGFVTYCCAESATQAMATFNGMVLHDGIALNISYKVKRQSA